MTEKKPMRLVFGETLCDIADEYQNMVVLDADVSGSTQTKLFGRKYPGRFYNFGIAEGNMVSAAAGMSTFGLIPVVSTFAFLLALRAGDPLQSLISYNSLNVKLAGGYSGLSDFADGASHQSVLDLAIMRAMPNMTVLAPSDIESTRGAVRAMIEHKGPVYLRLSRDLAGSIHNGREDFEIGRANILRDGTDITLCVCGTLTEEVIKSANILEKHGISASVLEFPTIKPFDCETLLKYASKSGRVLTVEEHSIIGGLGSAAADCVSEASGILLKKIGMPDCFGESGCYTELLGKFGMLADNIVNSVKHFLM
jgi:transketolase